MSSERNFRNPTKGGSLTLTNIMLIRFKKKEINSISFSNVDVKQYIFVIKQ